MDQLWSSKNVLIHSSANYESKSEQKVLNFITVMALNDACTEKKKKKKIQCKYLNIQDKFTWDAKWTHEVLFSEKFNKIKSFLKQEQTSFNG